RIEPLTNETHVLKTLSPIRIAVGDGGELRPLDGKRSRARHAWLSQLWRQSDQAGGGARLRGETSAARAMRRPPREIGGGLRRFWGRASSPGLRLARKRRRMATSAFF